MLWRGAIVVASELGMSLLEGCSIRLLRLSMVGLEAVAEFCFEVACLSVGGNSFEVAAFGIVEEV